MTVKKTHKVKHRHSGMVGTSGRIMRGIFSVLQSASPGRRGWWREGSISCSINSERCTWAAHTQGRPNVTFQSPGLEGSSVYDQTEPCRLTAVRRLFVFVGGGKSGHQRLHVHDEIFVAQRVKTSTLTKLGPERNKQTHPISLWSYKEQL